MKKMIIGLCVAIILVCAMPISVYAHNEINDRIYIDKLSTPCNIVIDGYFDDWEDKPKVALTYNWPNPNDPKISIMTDGINIYCYASYKERGNFSGTEFRLAVNNNRTVEITVYYNQSKVNEKYPVDVFKTGEQKIGYGLLQAKFDLERTQDPNKGPKNDCEYEFVIPIKNLEKYGVDTKNIQSLKLSSHTFGNGYITVQGTSTGVYISIGLVIAFACFGFISLKKKKGKI